MGLVTMTFNGPANSPSRRFTRTVSIVVPSKTTKGWPWAELTFTSGARLLAAVAGAVAACVGAVAGKLEERAGALPPMAAGSADGCAAPRSARTRFEVKRALHATAV